MEINRYLINPMKLDQLSRALICGTSLLGLAGTTAFGQTDGRYDGGEGNRNWGHGINWDPNHTIPNTLGHRAQFTGNNGGDTNVLLNTSPTIGQFQVINPATAVSLRGSGANQILTLTPTQAWAAGVGLDMSTATKNFTFDGTTGTAWTVRLGSSQSWNVTSANAAGNLTSNSGVTVNLQSFTLTTNAGTGRTITIAGPITGTGGVTKTGVGILAVNGAANTYSGKTTISNGTLALGASGSINNSPEINVASGATFNVSAVTGGYTLNSTTTLSGSGTVTGSMTVAGTLSPGNSPGTLSTGSQTWMNGGDYNWQVADVTGAAGTAYDTIAITGTLDLASLAANGFAINLWSLASTGPDVNGDASGFSDLSNYQWTLVTTNGGITGFDAANFAINTSANNGTAGFSNAFTGSFNVSSDGNNLFLNYAAVPEPSSIALLGLGIGALALRRRRA